MLEMICAIPENIGWVMVGAVGMLCAVMLVKLGSVIVEAIKERREEMNDGNRLESESSQEV